MSEARPNDWQARCRRIEVLILDVDGVLTDGGIVYGDDGREWKHFHARDGSGIKLWQAAGKTTAILSGRVSSAVERRAAELGVTRIIQGVERKLPEMFRLLDELGLTPDQACCVGDDLADLPLVETCGLGVAVADACTDLRRIAHLVTTVRGGDGAVREVIETILGVQGLWSKLVAECRTAAS
jgi:YrbI family 3-deoxy-D-manno-octulosonate 8-phosphate phosphatase